MSDSAGPKGYSPCGIAIDNGSFDVDVCPRGDGTTSPCVRRTNPNEGAIVPRRLYHRVDPARFDLFDGRSRRSPRPTAWKHNGGGGRTALHDANGERLQGDGIRREGARHPVVGGGTPLGRPENEIEALMQTAPFQDAEQSSAEADASAARVDALLALLPLRQRQIATLVVLEGLSVRDAAERLAPLSKSQVARDWAKARDQLAELLGGELPNGQVQESLESLAPEHAPELGDYQEPAEDKQPVPDVAAEEWERYSAAQARMRRNVADKVDRAFVARFEKRNGLASSFSPGWR